MNESIILSEFDKLVNSGVVIYNDEQEIIEYTDGQLKFQFCLPSALAKKPTIQMSSPESERKNEPQTQKIEGSDISTGGFEIGEASSTHFLVANKFCWARPHLMLVTSDGYQRQYEALDLSDIKSAWRILSAMNNDYVAFYNCGQDGGCSRLHKHLQLIPTPKISRAPIFHPSQDKGRMSLKYYLEQAFKESRLTSESDLSRIQHLDGILKPDEENLILVYGGSFNPPHRGHIDVLLSGLNPQVAAISIIILPSEDFHLRNKLAKSHSQFFINMKRRADIWEAIPSIPKTKVWVWPNTWYPFKACTDALIRLTQKDGFEIAFSHLIGPDNVDPRDPLMILPYRLPRILVTDKARNFDAHFLPSRKPKQWDGFGEWTRNAQGNQNDNGQANFDDAVLWKCTAVDESVPRKSCWYLQHLKPAATDINSTDLRRSLAQNNQLDEEILNNLSTEALMQLVAPLLQAG